MKPVIRRAKRDDIPTLVHLIQHAFQPVAERFELTKDNCPKHPSQCTATWIEDAFDKGIVYFILETNRMPCGCVALEEAGDKFYLERLAVLPIYQHLGYGKLLVSHCFETVIAHGKKRIEIGIIRKQTDLYEWYLKQGFQEIRNASFSHLPFEVTFMGIDLD